MSLTESQLAPAAALLRAGRLVAFPTETVYGLGANALDARAVERIFQAKGRPSTSPLIVHVASLEMARSLAAEWPGQAQRLAERFWPGPLTLVVRKHPGVPGAVTAGLPTVGLRMPSHPVALALIRAAGLPLAAPSANRFSQVSPTTAAHVRAGLGDRVDLVLDGGPAGIGIESTVLSVAEQPPVLYRPGAVPREEIEKLIGPLRMPAQSAEPSAHPSPGLHSRHYSPATPLLLLDGDTPLPPGRGALLFIARLLGAHRGVRMPACPREYAAGLYARLHELDGEGWDWIAVERPPSTPGWEAVNDRLRRAAGR